MNQPPRRWLSGLGAHDWGGDNRAYAALLDALTRDRLETEVVARELAAPEQPPGMDLKRVEESELEAAGRELEEFREALTDVQARGGGDPRAEVAFDSGNARQDAAADVLIQYLVRPGYAEVRTEEPTSEHYVYYIRVDWPKLRSLAEEQGYPLPE